MLYLKRLKTAIEDGVLAKLGSHSFVDPLFDAGQIRQLFHRKIWLTLGCPRIDDVGAKVHRELGLDSRVQEFKRSLLSCTLVENIFKAHQAMLAYGQSKLEYQTLSVETPIINPSEEEKLADDTASLLEVNEKLA